MKWNGNEIQFSYLSKVFIEKELLSLKCNRAIGYNKLLHGILKNYQNHCITLQIYH